MENSTCRWEEHGEISLSLKFQPDRTARLEDINVSIPSISSR